MTDPQWVAPGSGAPTDPAAGPPGGHAAPPPPHPPAPPLQPPAAPPVGAGAVGAGPAWSQGQPGWGAHPAMEFRPGIIPLRPLNLGDVYGAVLKAIRGNVAATMGLAFVTTLLFLVPTTALGVWVAAQQEVLDVGTDDVFPVAGTLGSLVPSLGTSGSTILLTGFVAFVISQAVMGRRVSAGQTWEGTRGRILPLVGATIVTGLAVLLAIAAVVVLPVLAIISAVQTQSVAPDNSGLVLAILFGVAAALIAVLLALWLSTRLAFVGVAVVLEKAGVGRGIARSWALTSGSQFWRVLGIRILTGFIVGVAAQILAFPLGAIGGVAIVASGDPQNTYVFQAIVSGVTGLITGALTTPFTAGVDALLYVDQRIRREGFDVQLITAAQADADRAWPGATAAR
ncbi:hypothetical protein SAMN04489867_2011 [Pedococcus dokdonensis]|uniref:DUF7847 domain-containing protein n=1 Tax=Pedococcus dokdonensis TaxID=443156 RepID=A0A1H0RLP6_9MICO|nr:hypothetical protein [Pedococcus dokdonensis]SDP30320.1 hypothetical protein SAMN04489867_2011 [Pedococcus dokdonensis]